MTSNYNYITTFTDSERCIRVLPREDVRVTGHSVLRDQEEGPTDNLPPHVPPHGDAHDLVGGHQVLPGGARDPDRGHQLVCSHYNVLVLHDGRYGPAVPEVLVLEETYHHSSNGKYQQCSFNCHFY